MTEAWFPNQRAARSMAAGGSIDDEQPERTGLT
jgi:hypothetical protein